MVRKTQAVKIQSYLDEERGLFLASDVVSPHVPVPHKNAYFARNSYYHLLLRYLFRESLQEGKLAHHVLDGVFVPLIPPASLNDEKMSELAARVIPLVQTQHLPHMEASIWQQWKAIEDNYVPYAEQPVVDIFTDFLLEAYFPTMEQIIQQIGSAVTPKVDVEVNATKEEMERRQTMLACLATHDLEAVEERVREKWVQQSSKFPGKLRANRPTEPPQRFWEEHYYLEMFFLFGRRTNMQGSDVRKLKDDRASHCSWNEAMSSQTSTDSNVVAPDGGAVPQAKRLRVPFDVASVPIPCMSKAAGTLVVQGCASIGNVVPEDGSVFGIDALLDGTAFNGHVDVQAVPTTNYLSSKIALEASRPGLTRQYEGWLLYNPEAPRTVEVTEYNRSPSKRKTDQEDKVETEILDCVFMDDTGPLLVALWGGCVQSLLTYKENFPARGRLLVHLSAVATKSLKKDNWNGECLSNIRVLSTVQPRGQNMGTQITFPLQPGSPFVGHAQFVIPGPNACIVSFMAVKSKLTAPFRGSFAGTVADVQETAESMRGNPKKFFDLVDASGHWFTCCAWGRNATSKALTNGAKIAVYYGTGRTALGDSPAAFYLFDEAVIIQIGRVQSAIGKRVQLEWS